MKFRKPLLVSKLFIMMAACLFVFYSGAVAQEQTEKEGEKEKEDKTLVLNIGHPKYKEKILEITPEGIFSARSGKPVEFAKMVKEMKDSRFVYVGESHNSLPMHDIQLKVIKALYDQDPYMAIGLEMLPAGVQEVLDKWSRGELSEEEFIRDVRWYVNWNFNYGFYAGIFAFAREKNIPVFALNVPREVITKIRMKGWEGLSEEEKALVPKPDLSHEEHRFLIRTIFESTELPHQMKGEGLEMVFEGLYRAQSAWDEVMAANAIQGAAKEGRRMVVLAGSGHLLYNLGINRRVAEKKKLTATTILAVSVPSENKSIRVSRSFADYVWGIEEEEKPVYPSVGLSFKKFESLENLVLERKPIDGVAKGQDFEKGDVVLTVDRKTFDDINELRFYLARFAWEDEVKIRLLRGGEVKEVSLKFQYQPE